VKKVTARVLRKIDDEEEQNYMLSEKLSDESYGDDEEKREYYIKDGEFTNNHYN
jgi:hypothetical protein